MQASNILSSFCLLLDILISPESLIISERNKKKTKKKKKRKIRLTCSFKSKIQGVLFVISSPSLRNEVPKREECN